MRERSDAFWLIALPLLLLLLFSDILFFGDTLYFRDIFREYYPSRAVLHDLLRSGTFPFWNPRYACGQPFAANPGYQVFYPVGLLTLWLPDFRIAFHLEVVAHYFLAAFGMYALLRSCRLRPDSAALAAISWSTGGLLTALSNLLPFLFAAAWLPLLILFVRRAALRFSRFDFACATLVLGVILLNGDQAMIVQAGCVTVAVAIYCGRGVARAIGLAAAMILGASLVGVVAVVPAIDFVRDSGRSLPLARTEVLQWSLIPLRPLELFFPALFSRFTAQSAFDWSARLHPPFSHPFFLSIYPGMIVAVFAAGGLIRRARGYGLALVAIAGSYAIAVGTPVFTLLYAVGVRSFRYPEKFFIPAVLAVTILGAFAFDDFARVRRPVVVMATIVAAVAIAMSIVTLLPVYGKLFDAVWRIGPAPLALKQSQIGWFIAAVVAIVNVVVMRTYGRLPLPVWSALCVLLLVADLAPRNRGLMQRMPPEFATPPPLAATIGPSARVFNRADWQYFTRGSPPVPASVQPWMIRNALLPRSYATWGLSGAVDLDITRTDLLPMQEFTAAFWRVAKARPDRVELMLRMAGVTHIIDALPMNEWSGKELEELQPVTVTALVAPRRVWIARQVVDANFERRLLSAATFAPSVAFVSAPATAFTPDADVLRVDEKPNSIAADVRARGTALLVVATTAHNDWRAAIDGRPAPILRANIAFQALAVPTGRHHVELCYRNDLLLVCGAISVIATVAAALLAVAGWHDLRFREKV